MEWQKGRWEWEWERVLVGRGGLGLAIESLVLASEIKRWRHAACGIEAKGGAGGDLELC